MWYQALDFVRSKSFATGFIIGSVVSMLIQIFLVGDVSFWLFWLFILLGAAVGGVLFRVLAR